MFKVLDKVQENSYMNTKLIAKEIKTYNIVEPLIPSSCKETVQCLAQNKKMKIIKFFYLIIQ